MLVVAKQVGEYPLGRWRQPGEKFEFDGGKPALWMLTAEDVDKSKAEDKAKAEEAAEIIKAQSEAVAKVRAKHAASAVPKDDAEALVLAKKVSKGIHELHKGFGKWDVLGENGDVVKDGSGLSKADASALVQKLLADKAEA